MSKSDTTDGSNRREQLREKGWSDDVSERRSRRPKQKIDSSDRKNRSGNLTITPSWLYACTECGEEKRLASEDVAGWDRCDSCEEVRLFEPLGELVYPDTEK